jgi:hypothetical protein
MALRARSRLAVVALVGAMMAMPGVARAQAGPGNPFTPGLPQNTGSVATTTTSAPGAPLTTTTAGSSSVSGGGIAAIAAGALVILLGISFFIWRDARRRAPVKQGMVAATAGGSKPRPKPRKLSPQERRRRKRGRAR